MSADNWDVCPRCAIEHRASIQRLSEEAASSYGMIPADEYLALLEEANNPPKLSTTLREDYELGIDENNEFYVIYDCSCRVCGFSYSYKHVEILDITGNHRRVSVG